MRNREPSATMIGLLRRAAARHSRVAHEAEDLVQDILLAAIESGRDCNDSRFLPWAYGAVRNRARFAARSAARRKRRERIQPAGTTEAPPSAPRFSDGFIAALPRSQRLVALLANLGMGRREIGYLLGLSDIALRQRIRGLKRAALAKAERPEEGEPSAGSPPDGRARRALKASLPKSGGRRFAIRDPDGLPIFFAVSAHIPGVAGNKEGKPQPEDPK